VNFGLLHWGMLAGLAGAAIPVVIHLLNRRRTTTIDWGAMQFLELGRRAQVKFRLSELLLMAGRMAILALVALALARPFWTATASEGRAGSGGSSLFGGERRDVVIVIDGSGSMGRKAGPSNLITQAITWARELIAQLKPGDSVAILVARDRITPLVVPASYDKKRVESALAEPLDARGSSDLPLALAQALKLLERPGNPARDVFVLSDGQQESWRPDDVGRWSLVRELHHEVRRVSGASPRIRAITFSPPAGSAASNGSVGPLTISGGLFTPHRPIEITTVVANAGPSPLTRTAELFVDGKAVPGSAQIVGPLASTGKMPLIFRTSIAEPGSHALAVRLTGEGDLLADDDESTRALEVAPALAVLLVDGEPGVEPLSAETDFLRAALAPSGADTIPVKARVVRADAFQPDDLKGERVAVLANVERLEPREVSALTQFLSAGGGVVIALGDKVDATFANLKLGAQGAGWLPARLGLRKGDMARRLAVAHPAPSTFTGVPMAALGQGNQPPLAAADLFEFWLLEPAQDAATTARLDTGDPWIVERPFGRGRVALVAGPLDAEGGTLPVNPDFVPWAHEIIYHMASPSAAAHAARPGEPLVVDLQAVPAPAISSLAVTTPGGNEVRGAVVRSQGGAQVRIDATDESGLYRVHLPDPPGGLAFATVAADSRESDLRPLEPAVMTQLERDLPLAFESNPERLPGAYLFAPGPGGRNELWRYLVLAALAGLCMEVWLTRRMVKNSGFADLRGADDSVAIESPDPPRSAPR
jgi:hypothetical protein